jgi:hypothetical protein
MCTAARARPHAHFSLATSCWHPTTRYRCCQPPPAPPLPPPACLLAALHQPSADRPPGTSRRHRHAPLGGGAVREMPPTAALRSKAAAVREMPPGKGRRPSPLRGGLAVTAAPPVVSHSGCHRPLIRRHAPPQLCRRACSVSIPPPLTILIFFVSGDAVLYFDASM